MHLSKRKHTSRVFAMKTNNCLKVSVWNRFCVLRSLHISTATRRKCNGAISGWLLPCTYAILCRTHHGDLPTPCVHHRTVQRRHPQTDRIDQEFYDRNIRKNICSLRSKWKKDQMNIEKKLIFKNWILINIACIFYWNK